MDSTDLKIIHLLKQNARITSSEISKKINLSIPAVIERIRKLEEMEVIQQYTIKLNRTKFNLKLISFVLVNIEKTEYIEHFREYALNNEHVLECHHLAGTYDYLLKVVTEDTSKLEEFITDSLKKVNGVSKSNTIIVLSTLKETIC